VLTPADLADFVQNMVHQAVDVQALNFIGDIGVEGGQVCLCVNSLQRRERRSCGASRMAVIIAGILAVG
jgi:hypothetical protein